MPKQLINLIGILVAVAVLALGIFLVAMPLATQALGTLASADQVDQTNKLYQAQVDALTKAKENKAETDAAVAELRAQIPAVPHLDDVFALVGRAAQSSGVTITSIAAGTPAAFVPPVGAQANGQPAPVPAPSPSATASGIVGQAQNDRDQSNAQTAQENAATGAAAGTTAQPAAPAPSTTRTQIGFTITVTAVNLDQITAFLDALREGPRLLSNVSSVVAQNNGSAQASVNALTFVDGAPIATGATK
ncbi:hypothetical protein [Microbacterium candidum]|uniref:Tfp pilus assembly protein PilO n=1 Tax=Microbacterium candidum TaxID=3041922 RepID=A0ABT7N3V2_9MICO|nr:hypothetical protein [Microbacterium sp. ASV49]MDL9981379.1 hypothetical protein [Microbacterium sp. ASV49]